MQIVLGIVFLSQTLFTGVFADVQYVDGHDSGVWYSSKQDPSYSHAVISTSPNAPLPAPVIEKTLIINTVTH